MAVRDYHIIGFRKQGYTEKEAYSKSRQAIVAFFCAWYLSLVMGFAAASYKLGFRPVFNHSFPSALMMGLLILAPYVLIMWQIAGKIMHVPLNETRSYKRLGWITWLVVLTGMLMMGIVPAVLQQVLPALPPRP